MDGPCAGFRAVDTHPWRGVFMRLLVGTVFVLLTLAASEARAAQLIAVLPLDVRMTSGKVTAEAQASLEEMLRDAATNALAPMGWTVLTGETTLQVLRDNGVNPEECGNQSCHLEMAREIKADKFLSGSVQYVEGQFIASIRLIDTETGRILTSERATGKTITRLREAFEARAQVFFVRSGLLESAPPDDVRLMKHELKPLGGLSITGEPWGAAVEVTGPGGFQDAGSLPWEGTGLTRGTYRVRVARAGYLDTIELVKVDTDTTAMLTVALQRIAEPSRPRPARIRSPARRYFLRVR